MDPWSLLLALIAVAAPLLLAWALLSLGERHQRAPPARPPLDRNA